MAINYKNAEMEFLNCVNTKDSSKKFFLSTYQINVSFQFFCVLKTLTRQKSTNASVLRLAANRTTKKHTIFESIVVNICLKTNALVKSRVRPIISKNRSTMLQVATPHKTSGV